MNFSLNSKLLTIKSKDVPGRFIFTLLVILSSSIATIAQVENPIRTPSDPLPLRPDSIGLNIVIPRDSIRETTTVPITQDSIPPAQNSDIETTIVYSARDSINFSLDQQIIKLYGAAKITYGDIQLEAEEIVIDYNLSTISADGRLDSLGRRVGYPIFRNGGETYETRSMVYNFKTKRAKISEVVTQQGDGYLHGEVVFKNDKNELFSIHNAYTTCNLPHPHYQIISKRSKAIPNDKVVSGPFYLEFSGIPTPLGFLFGIFPAQQRASSGIIVPSYGEERVRGFFLKGGGYFFDINDYVNLSVTGDIYSKGSTALYLRSDYRKRYAYNGSFNLSFTNNLISNNIENKAVKKDFQVTWRHTPQTVRTGRFSASVDVASGSYNENNFLGINTNTETTRLDNTTRKLTSNVKYAKSFPGTPFNLGIDLTHNQDLSTGQVDLLLPSANLTINNIYPFKNSDIDVIKRFTLGSQTFRIQNKVTNNLGRIGQDPATDSIAPFTLKNLPTFFENSLSSDKTIRGIKFNFPISTSLPMFNYITLSPNLTYSEVWYFKKLDWELDPVSQTPVVSDTLKGFNRISNYSGGVSLTTRLYGMYSFRQGKVRAIRHVMNPTISYNIGPDFGLPKYDYYQTLTLANGKEVRKSRHEGFAEGTSSQGKREEIAFTLNNSIEMKVQNEADSIPKKISILNSLGVSGRYNLAADSFKLSTFNLSANTNVLQNKLSINIGATLDPYVYRLDSIVSTETTTRVYQTRIDRYAWKNGFDLGQITRVNLALSTNLSPRGRENDKTTQEKIAEADISESEKELMLNNPDAYIDFDIPWNLRVSYNLVYTKTGYQEADVTQTLRFSGDISLTEKWKINFNSGYDLENKKFTQTSMGVNRDLHCWQMSFNWNPFGRFQSYSFTIGVKSSLLRDLKLDRQRSFQDLL